MSNKLNLTLKRGSANVRSPLALASEPLLSDLVHRFEEVSDHTLFLVVEDLDELNMYCWRYHHGENPNAATEPIDDAELQGYVRRTLKLVGYPP